jgi:hypothetical protein
MPLSKTNRLLPYLSSGFSKATVDEICEVIASDPSLEKDLRSAFFSDDLEVVKMAAWTLHHYMDSQPDKVLEYFPQALDTLKNPLHDSQVRNLLRMLQFTPIPEDLQGPIAEICYEKVDSPAVPSAIRVFCLQILWNISSAYPEWREEINEMMSTMEHKTKGLANRWMNLNKK